MTWPRPSFLREYFVLKTFNFGPQDRVNSTPYVIWMRVVSDTQEATRMRSSSHIKIPKFVPIAEVFIVCIVIVLTLDAAGGLGGYIIKS